MAVLEMKRQDLLELYQLLALYERTYQKDFREWKEEIGERYYQQTGKEIEEAHNPRGAGRKKKYTEEENQTIYQCYQEGKSLREIAKETHCSVGHVQDIIKERKRK